MKRNLMKTFLIASVLTVSGAVLPASAAETVRVSVPFSFMVGSAKMAAGDYSVTQSENGMLTLTGAKTSAMVLTVPAGSSNSNNAGLSFNSSANERVLTSIQLGGDINREIPLHNGADRKVALASAR